MMTPTQKLLVIFPSKSSVARAFGVTYETVRVWCRDGLPLHRAHEIEKRTHGDIKAVDILMAAKSKKKSA
jgi:hypothetical protein